MPPHLMPYPQCFLPGPSSQPLCHSSAPQSQALSANLNLPKSPTLQRLLHGSNLLSFLTRRSPQIPEAQAFHGDLDRSGVADSRIRLRFQLAPRITWDGAGCWELGAGVGCPESSISAREKVDARRERPLGDLGGPTSSADARRREVRTQVRGRAGIDGEMIHARRSGPRGGAPGIP